MSNIWLAHGLIWVNIVKNEPGVKMYGEQGNKPEVSVIVPVYNIDSFLPECFDSLRNQTLKNIEVIVVDDGSTDKSGSICDEYASQDRRFVVIHKTNQGLSEARNDGLSLAKADYIMFVDGDDWVEPEFCEIPVRVAKETESEIVIFLRNWHDKENDEKQESFPMEGYASEKTVLTDLWSLVGVIVWNKLYHKRLFEDLRFPTGRLSEDTAVTHRLIHKAKKIYLLNKYLYNHRVNRDGSILSSRSIKFLEDEAVLSFKRMQDLTSWGIISEEKEAIAAMSYLMRIGENGELSSSCRKLLDGYKRFTESSTSWKTKLMLMLYHTSPKLFDAISIISGKRMKKLMRA